MNMHPRKSEDPILKLCPEKLILQVPEFHHDPESDLAFNNWFYKCEDGVRKALADVPEEKRVRVLLQILGTAEHNPLKRYICPIDLDDHKFHPLQIVWRKFI